MGSRLTNTTVAQDEVVWFSDGLAAVSDGFAFAGSALNQGVGEADGFPTVFEP
jgi:hypothetical protein